MNHIKKNIRPLLPIALICAAIAIMAIVPSVPIRFAPGPDMEIVEYKLYFNIYLIGYAQFFPFITAVISCIWLLLSISAGRYKNGSFKLLSFGELITAKPVVIVSGTAALVCSGACIGINGAERLFSPGSVIIFVLLALALIFQIKLYLSHILK